MAKNKEATVFDIAERAGVSIATVSRVLNNSPSVRNENKIKVQQAVKELSYVHLEHQTGRSSTMTIGLVVPDIANPWFPALIKGVENVARTHDFGLLLADSENSVATERENIQTMIDRGVDGMILIPTDRRNESVMRLFDEKFPLVFLDRCIEGRPINFVTSANRDGAYQATRYLINLGHRHIVYIAGSEEIDTEWKRRAGFLDAISDAGLPKEELIIVEGNYTTEKARKEITALLRDKREFSAVFASDDIMAYGAKAALEAHGLRIPEDVALIGFDDIAYSSLINLTTVAQSPFELGKNAMLLLEDIISERVSGPQLIELPTRLVIRNSCAHRFPQF